MMQEISSVPLMGVPLCGNIQNGEEFHLTGIQLVLHTEGMFWGYNPELSLELLGNYLLLGLEGHFEINCESFLSYFSLLLNCIVKFVTDLMRENISLYLFI